MEQHNTILEGIHYSSGSVIRLETRNGSVFSLNPMEKALQMGEEIPADLPVIAPGLVDIQINGFMGVDFNDPDLTVAQVELASKALLQTGVTTYCPTLITGSPDRTSTLLKTFAEVSKAKGLASQMIGGIHLEGPFISKEDGPRGAHQAQYCLDPDIRLLNQWKEEAQGQIRIITLAPELPGSKAFIKSCIEMGLVVGIGHTSATTDDIKRAADAGATLSTHLGNGCHTTLPRHPNYIWDQLGEERLYASMIADGFHLPDAVLSVFMRLKKEKAILISDGMTYTGLEPGTYDSSATGRVRLTPEGKLHAEGNESILAGSASTLLKGISRAKQIFDFPTAWDMGSVHPARLLNQTSGLVEGAPADLVLLKPDLDRIEVLGTYKLGVQQNRAKQSTA